MNFRTGSLTALFLSICLLAGCHTKHPEPTTLSGKIAKAHGAQDWRLQGALVADIHAEFENGSTFDARLTYQPSTGKCRMLLPDNTVLVFDGQTAWVSPPSSRINNAQARAILKTWPFFVAAPFQLSTADLGPTETRNSGGQKYDSARINLDKDNWRIVCADSQTHRVYAIAYPNPVQAGGSGPQAITYYDFKEHDNVLLANLWRFWNWSDTEGIYGKPVGDGRIYNVEFVTPKSNVFEKPINARAE